MTTKDERPWGWYEILDEWPGCKVKRIVVKPGAKFSYQTHARRSEYWTIVSGSGRVIVDGLDRYVGKGDVVEIKVGQAHRAAASAGTDEPLIFVEVQLGEYLGEDDIVRLEDDYGRGNH